MKRIARLTLSLVLLPLSLFAADKLEKPKADAKDPTEVEIRQAIQKYLTEKTGRAPLGTATPTKTP